MKNTARVAALLPLVALLPTGCGFAPKRLAPPDSIFDTIRVPPRQGAVNAKDDSGKDVPLSTLNDDIDAQLATSYVSLRDPTEKKPGHIPTYVKGGYDVIDGRCNAFLTRLGLAAQDYQYASQELTLVGTATAAVQGLTKVASKEIALTSLLFGLGTSSGNAYATVYLFSPDISAVRGLIDKTRDGFKDTAERRTTNYSTISIEDANTLLRNYDSICRVDSIRALVNQSVASAKPIPVFPNPAEAPTDPVVLANYHVLLGTIEPELGKLFTPAVTLSESQVLALYGLSNAPTMESEQKAIASALATIPAIVDGTSRKLSTSIDPKLMTNIRVGLAPLVVNYRSIVELKYKSLVEPAPANVATATSPAPAVTPAPAPAPTTTPPPVGTATPNPAPPLPVTSKPASSVYFSMQVR